MCRNSVTNLFVESVMIGSTILHLFYLLQIKKSLSIDIHLFSPFPSLLLFISSVVFAFVSFKKTNKQKKQRCFMLFEESKALLSYVWELSDVLCVPSGVCENEAVQRRAAGILPDLCALAAPQHSGRWHQSLPSSSSGGTHFNKRFTLRWCDWNKLS